MPCNSHIISSVYLFIGDATRRLSCLSFTLSAKLYLFERCRCHVVIKTVVMNLTHAVSLAFPRCDARIRPLVYKCSHVHHTHRLRLHASLASPLVQIRRRSTVVLASLFPSTIPSLLYITVESQLIEVNWRDDWFVNDWGKVPAKDFVRTAL